jgi:hypothetical protein
MVHKIIKLFGNEILGPAIFFVALLLAGFFSLTTSYLFVLMLVVYYTGFFVAIGEISKQFGLYNED